MGENSNLDAHPYSRLTPDLVLDAVAASGLAPDGRLLTLNSYENRVYQVGIDDGPMVVVKFYRPERWTDAQIDEEHAFAHELKSHEIPVVAPQYSGHHEGFRFAVYPRRGGRTPELGDPRLVEGCERLGSRVVVDVRGSEVDRLSDMSSELDALATAGIHLSIEDTSGVSLAVLARQRPDAAALGTNWNHRRGRPALHAARLGEGA